MAGKKVGIYKTNYNTLIMKEMWRRWMGIEPTARGHRATGFEDQGSHQTTFTSKLFF